MNALSYVGSSDQSLDPGIVAKHVAGLRASTRRSLRLVPPDY